MFLYWLANNNFGYYTKRFIEEGVREFKPIWLIRRLQCDLFGHDWFTFLKDSGWCAWCGRKAGKYPRMRVRQPENKESLQSITQHAKGRNRKGKLCAACGFPISKSGACECHEG